MNKRFFFLLLISFLLSGCYLFRHKNKCADCPGWKKSGHAKQPAITHLTDS